MPSLQAHILRWVLNRIQPLSDGHVPIDELRARVARQPFSRPPRDVAIERGAVGGVPCEWLIPPGTEQGPVLLYLHGGGWVLGWMPIYRRMVARLGRAAGCRVLAVDYRLAPEHPFPAALEDCAAVYRGLLAGGLDPRRLAVAGDSAGGNLTLTTLISLRDAGVPPPAAAVCISPSVDLEGAGPSFWTARDPVISAAVSLTMRRLYIGGHDPREPLLSPIHADLSGLPPLLIHAGAEEILRDDAQRLADQARAAGLDVRLTLWPGMWHVWHLFLPWLPEARQALDEIAAFLRQHLPPPARP